MAANDLLIADTQKLVQDIFLLTGQKVEANDPIVVAALIQSSLIRRAGSDAEAGIKAVMAKALGELADGNRQQQAVADQLARDVKALRGLVVGLAAVVGIGIVVGIWLAKFSV